MIMRTSLLDCRRNAVSINPPSWDYLAAEVGNKQRVGGTKLVVSPRLPHIEDSAAFLVTCEEAGGAFSYEQLFGKKTSSEQEDRTTFRRAVKAL